MKKIPKIIHYVWVGGQEKNEMAIHCIDSWKKTNPEYKIMEWNEETFNVEENKQVKQALNEKNWAYASDIIRVFALKEYGGIYLDTDVKLLKSLDDLLENELFLSYESKYWFGSAVIGSKPNNEAIQLIWQRYTTNHKISFNTNALTVHAYTAALRKLYNFKPNGKSLKTDQFYALSSEYFYPIDYMTLKENITNNTYGIHYYKGSWHTKKQQNSFNFAKSSRKIFGKYIFGFFENMVAKSYDRKLQKEFKKIRNQ